MTTVQNNTVSTTLLNSVNGTKNTAATTASSTQDRFMKLLVTQMKNQDPLNPMDNAQMTSQMAQLSTVSGIEKLNATVESLISNTQLSQSFQATNMIGRTVLVNGNKLDLQNKQSLYGINLATAADNVTVTVRNANGTAVNEIALGAQLSGQLPVMQWNGTTTSGPTAPDGQYTFEVKATLKGQTVTSSTQNYSQVQSISNGTDGVKLKLSDSSSISASDVKQIF